MCIYIERELDARVPFVGGEVRFDRRTRGDRVGDLEERLEVRRDSRLIALREKKKT